MKTDRTTINNPRHPEYYAEARDAIMDLCPFYDPNHKGGIVREAVFKSCLQELREREKVVKETMETLAMEWKEVGQRFKDKGEDGYDHRGEIFLECARRVREILGQNV
jgi:hypothetical protein